MSITFDYLIIGSGMAADAAAKGIREFDDVGRIGIVGDDADPPYTRPALTKKLWTDPEFNEDDNWLHTGTMTGATIMSATEIVSIDPDSHIVVSRDKKEFGYDQLLLATGGTVNTVDMPASERSIYFRTFADYRALRRLSGYERQVAVIGGSYIGMELAAGLAQNNTQVTLIYPQPILGGDIFPEPLAQAMQADFGNREIRLLGNTRVESGSSAHDSTLLRFADGSEQRFDGVVSGLGITPRTALAQGAGVEINNGIVVDEQLRTNIRDIYAAGDVACYPDRILGRQRVEHVNNATSMGATAGRIMAGSNEVYDHTPYYYSNVFDISWQAVGTLDSSLQTIADWREPLQSGVIYYLRNDRVAGVLLWNLADKLDAARAVLADERPQDAATLKARI